MTTVGDAIERVSRLRQKQAVMDEAIEFLNQFIATDSYEPSKGIASPIGGDVIPQNVVEEVKDELFGERAKIEKEILELREQAVTGVARKRPVKKVAKRSPPKRRRSNAK